MAVDTTIYGDKDSGWGNLVFSSKIGGFESYQ